MASKVLFIKANFEMLAAPCGIHSTYIFILNSPLFSSATNKNMVSACEHVSQTSVQPEACLNEHFSVKMRVC